MIVVSQQEQGKNSFDGGKIKEFQPVLPDGSGGMKAFSTLFYWANAWSDNGGLIDIHPHRGFEILSYIIEGSVDHYDTMQQKWLPIEKGGAQIIRSGNGISHAEKLNPGTRMFQIWFDPNLRKSLGKKASYDDFKESDFPVEKGQGYALRHLSGGKGPVKMDADAHLMRVDYETGTVSIPIQKDRILAAVMFAGDAKINSERVRTGDFFLDRTEELTIQSESRGSFFLISLPLTPGYETYA